MWWITFYNATSKLAFYDAKVVLYGQLASGPLSYLHDKRQLPYNLLEDE